MLTLQNVYAYLYKYAYIVIIFQISCELSTAKNELESLAQALQEVSLSYDLVSQLLQINIALDAADEVNKDMNLLEVALRLKSAEEDLKSKSLGVECLEIFEALKLELMFQQTKHSSNTMQLWKKCLVWNDSSLDNQLKIVTLTLAPDIDNEELFKTLYFYDLLSSEMNIFAKKLLKDVLCPVISNVALVDWDGSTLSLKINVKEKKPVCSDVLNNLTIVFNFLSLQLNVKADSTSLFSELEKQISEEFCSYLIKNCLSSTVPKKRDELEAYKILVEEITAFEQLLKKIGKFLESCYQEERKI